MHLKSAKGKNKPLLIIPSGKIIFMMLQMCKLCFCLPTFLIVFRIFCPNTINILRIIQNGLSKV